MIDSELQPHIDQLLQSIQTQEKRQKLVTCLRRYIAPAVSLRLLRENQLAKLLDQTTLKKASVLFMDIRGYVQAVEAIEEARQDLGLTKRMLLDFFDMATSIIFKHEGVSGEFAGDRIMAIFGAPIPRPDDAIRALKTAIEFQIRFDDLCEAWQQQYESLQLHVGIGIHTGGPILIGDIGSRWRHELSVVGMTANIASRLEELTKLEEVCDGNGLNIIVSESTYRETESIAVFSEPREMNLRGVSKIMTFREVLRPKSGLDLDETPQEEEKRLAEYKQIESIAERIEGAAQRERSFRIRQSLSRIGEAFSLLGPDHVLDEVIEQGQRMVNAKRVSLSIVDREKEEIEFVKVVEDSPSKPLLHQRMAMDQGWIGKVVTTGDPLILRDMKQEDKTKTHFNGFDQMTQMVPRSMLCAPLKVKGQVIGAIQINDEEPNKFTEEDLEILVFIAAQAAAVFENARSGSELHKIGEAIVSSLDRDKILQTVMESTQRLLRANIVSLLLVDGQELEFVSVSPPSSAKTLLGTKMPWDEGFVGLVATTGNPLIESDVQAKNQRRKHFDKFDKPTGVVPRSMLCAPLKIEDEVIGVIQVIDERPTRFAKADLDVLRFIANQATIAVTNAQQLAKLRQSLDELERSRRKLVAVETRARLGDIAGKLVHELNNKLGAVRVFAKDILDEPGLPEQVQDSAKAILESVETSLKEIKELRLVLKQPEESKRVDLTATLEGVIERFRRERLLDGGHTSLIDDIDQALCPVEGSVRQIEYVVRNLLDNALDAIDENRKKNFPGMQGQIRVVSERVDNEYCAKVWIVDNGIGIAEEDREKIFAPEFTTKPEGKGMGYGLSWARLYVQELGGDIELVEHKGHWGSTFMIRFPLARNQDS